MRVLFYLPDTGAASLASTFAADVRETFGPSQFAAVIRKRQSKTFLEKNGLDGDFEHLVSEPEVFGDGQGPEPDAATLRELGDAYGTPTLWQYVTAERFLSMRYQGGMAYKYGTDRSRAELLQFVVHGLRQIEALFDAFRPDVVVACGIDVGSSVALMVDRVAHARGVPVAVPVPARFGALSLLNDTVYNRSARFDAHYLALRGGQVESPNRAEAARRLEAFRGGRNDLPHLARNTRAEDIERSSLRTLPRHTAKAVAVETLRVAREVRSASWRDFRAVSPLRRIASEQRTRFNRRRIVGSDAFSSGDPGDRYVLFPLHLEPEMSQLVYSPFHTNQLEAARNVAQSLPADTTLYVKDHTACLGVRSWSYYEKMARIPNVKLIQPLEDTTRMIRNSVGVVTVTGTAAIEAALLGKPTIVLGDPVFAVAEELVTRVPSYPDLPAALRAFEDWQPVPEAQVDYVTAALDLGAEVSPFDLCQAAFQRAPAQVRELDGYAAFWGQLADRFREIVGES